MASCCGGYSGPGGSTRDSCFPSNGKVITRHGQVNIRDIKPGDEVLAMNAEGELLFSEVWVITHDDPEATMRVVSLTTESGAKLRLSPGHYLPVLSQDGAPTFTLAAKVKEGDLVLMGSQADKMAEGGGRGGGGGSRQACPADAGGDPGGGRPGGLLLRGARPPQPGPATAGPAPPGLPLCAPGHRPAQLQVEPGRPCLGPVGQAVRGSLPAPSGLTSGY